MLIHDLQPDEFAACGGMKHLDSPQNLVDELVAIADGYAPHRWMLSSVFCIKNFMKLYLVKMNGRNNDELFYKVGVTNFRETMHRFTKFGEESERIQTSDRNKLQKLRAAFGGHIYEHPYSVTIVHEVVFDADVDAKATERDILDAVYSARHEPLTHFSGCTECFKANDDQLEAIITYMNQEAKDARAEGSSDEH